MLDQSTVHSRQSTANALAVDGGPWTVDKPVDNAWSKLLNEGYWLKLGQSSQQPIAIPIAIGS
jgi:hypothetical protein